MLLKANLHLHTRDDPKDRIRYSAFDAIDEAKKLNFGVLAVTCHRKFAYKKEHNDYARKNGILLIPGIEACVEEKDVLILNCDKKAEEIKTFADLKKYKNSRPWIFIIAPHPFVPNIPHVSIGKKLAKHINLFDAIELTVFSTDKKIFNFNKKARTVAKKYNKPLIATSDTHFLPFLKKGYALIDAESKTIEDFFSAIEEKKVENRIVSMKIRDMVNYKIKSILRKIF